jgi:hypothetical protein
MSFIDNDLQVLVNEQMTLGLRRGKAPSAYLHLLAGYFTYICTSIYKIDFMTDQLSSGTSGILHYVKQSCGYHDIV